MLPITYTAVPSVHFVLYQQHCRVYTIYYIWFPVKYSDFINDYYYHLIYLPIAIIIIIIWLLSDIKCCWYFSGICRKPGSPSFSRRKFLHGHSPLIILFIILYLDRFIFLLLTYRSMDFIYYTNLNMFIQPLYYLYCNMS